MTSTIQEFLDILNETFSEDWLVISSDEVVQIFSDHSIRVVDLSTGHQRISFHSPLLKALILRYAR